MWESLLGVDFTEQWHSRTVQVDRIYQGHWDVVVFQKTAGCAGSAVQQLSGDSRTVTKWHLLLRKGQGRQLEPDPSQFMKV